MTKVLQEQPIPLVGPDGRAELDFYDWLKAQDMQGAWRSDYTPAVTAASGTFTTVAASLRYKKIGTTIFFAVSVTITTVGTASGAINVSLPFTGAALAQVVAGRETSAGKAVNGLIAANGSSLSILQYDGTTAAASGKTLVLSGAIEAAA